MHSPYIDCNMISKCCLLTLGKFIDLGIKADAGHMLAYLG